jgi:hypothetical protein
MNKRLTMAASGVLACVFGMALAPPSDGLDEQWAAKVRARHAKVSSAETSDAVFMELALCMTEFGVQPLVSQGSTAVISHGVDLKVPQGQETEWTFVLPGRRGMQRIPKGQFLKHITTEGVIVDGCPAEAVAKDTVLICGMGERLLLVDYATETCMWVPLRGF